MPSSESKSSEYQQPDTSSTYFRLHNYFYILETIGVIIPILVGWGIFLFPPFFSWFEHPQESILSLFLIATIHAFLFIIYEISKKLIFFNIARYAYVIFFIYLISITGGINSSLIFLLMFPLLTSAVYLDKKMTRNMGFVVTLALALMIFLYPWETITGSLIVKHIVQTFLMGIISYLTYFMVIETLRQKYEKEQASKRLVEIVQIDRIKNDFLSVAQHQLRTPLSGVKWVLETVKADTTLNTDTISLIDAGLGSVKNSLAIINNMLKTAEDNSGNLTLTRDQVDIVGSVQSLIAELNFIALKKNVKVILISPQSIIITADRDKLKAALNNIIDNALKYSPNTVVNITIEEKAKNVSITVKDNGIGISPDDLPYVFERLHRGKNAVMLEQDESGVGLYISKRII